MRKAATTALALLVLLLLLSPVSPAWADEGDDDDDDDWRGRGNDGRGRTRERAEVQIYGNVVGIDAGSAGFLVQSGRRLWNVRLGSDTTVEFRGHELRGRGARGLRMINTGDFVRVHGRSLGNGLIRAREIAVRSRFESDRGLERPQPIFPGQPVFGGQPGTNLDLTGVVTGVGNEFDGAFQLNAGGRLWTVRLMSDARVEAANGALRGTGPLAVRILRAGDTVAVRGQAVAYDQIWARRVDVGIGTQPGSPPTVIQPPGLPPIFNPIPGQISRVVILQPTDGAQVSGEFVVVGQTTPGATVQVDVRTQFNLVSLPVASGTVTADGRGIFIFPVRTAYRLPGALLRITATSSFAGSQSSATAITVRQI